MREFPGRPSHQMPEWVKPGSLYHIRIRVRSDNLPELTDPHVGSALLASARRYHEYGTWHCRLFLLMPDHLHALLAFPPDKRMSDLISAWKGFQTKHHGIAWQGNYFDHRIRNAAGLEEKAAYILRNPVVKALCPDEATWPWVYRGHS